MPTAIHLSVHLRSTDSPMTVRLASDMPTMVHPSAHLHSSDSPMMTELAFRYANNDTPQCPLTSYRRSNGGGVSLPTYRQRYISVSTYYPTDSPWRWS